MIIILYKNTFFFKKTNKQASRDEMKIADLNEKYNYRK